MHVWLIVPLLVGLLQTVRSYNVVTEPRLQENQPDGEKKNCPITADSFASTYLGIVKEMDLVDQEDGKACTIPASTDQSVLGDNNFNDSENCKTLFYFSQRLVLDLNTTKECCLQNISSCHHNSSDTPSRTVDKAKAFGYGTAMVVVLSLLSLLGILILPFLRRNTALGRYYQHFNLFMIALGASALFSDAILHLLPQTLGSDDESHSSSDEHGGSGTSGRLVVWRTCAVVGGMYLFFLTEYILQWLTGGQHHSHGQNIASSEISEKVGESSGLLVNVKRSTPNHKDSTQVTKCAGCSLKPLAVLIICGDTVHNFTDGIALGASFSQSLALGFSTALAIIFHEIPHELGNFVILLSTGMKWQYVLLMNFFSTLSAFVGFYIGAGVGMLSAEANLWLLAIAAGTFLYVALVDLIPVISYSDVKGCTGLLLPNIGFFISFSILLVIALFEDDFNNLFVSHVAI